MRLDTSLEDTQGPTPPVARTGHHFHAWIVHIPKVLRTVEQVRLMEGDFPTQSDTV